MNDLAPSKAIPMPSNGPAELSPSLRRLRHLKKILASHLRAETHRLYDTFFTLHEDLGKSDIPEPFYTSEIVLDSANPQWCTISFDSNRYPTLKSQNKFVICIWEVKHKPMKQLLLLRIDMTELMFVSTLEIHFPPNTLLFELHDGFYVMRQVRSQLEEVNLVIRHDHYLDDENTKKISCTRAMFLNILAKQKELVEKQRRAQELSKKIEVKIDEKKLYFEKLKERNMKVDECERLKNEYEYQYDIYLKQKTDYEERKKALEPKKQLLKQAEITLQVHSQDVNTQRAILKEKKAELFYTKYLIERHTARLVRNLSEVYEIKEFDKEHDLYSINGFVLPNSKYDGYDEEKVATALGHVCHLTKLLSKYLDIPLRYKIISMMSRSKIIDEIRNNGRYPLYSKAQDYDNFAYAVFLLNKNIEQLLNSQKLPLKHLKHTLPNIKILMDYFIQKDRNEHCEHPVL